MPRSPSLPNDFSLDLEPKAYLRTSSSPERHLLQKGTTQHNPSDSQNKTEVELESTQEGDYVVRSINVNETNSFPQIENFNVYNDILWPGQILDGRAFLSATYTPVKLKRAPVTLSVSLESSTGENGYYPGTSLSTLVEDPSLSTTREAIRELVEKNATVALPVVYSYSSENVFSTDQLALHFGLPSGSKQLTERLGIHFDDKTIRTRKIFRFSQRAYTVSINSPDTVFSTVNQENDLRALLEDAPTPVYVSSVEYGSMFFMVIESDLEENTLQGALNLGFTNTTTAKSRVTERTTIKVLQYGGSSDLHGNIIEAMKTGGLPEIDKLLNNVTMGSALALPVAYHLKYLNDNALAPIVLSGNYIRKEYLKVNQGVRVTLKAFEFLDTDGAGSPEGYSSLTVTANCPDSTGKMKSTVAMKWNGGVNNVKPNKTDDYTFESFNKDVCYLSIGVRVVEEDAVSDDIATGKRESKVSEWDGRDLPVIASGDGALSRFTLTVQLLP